MLHDAVRCAAIEHQSSSPMTDQSQPHLFEAEKSDPGQVPRWGELSGMARWPNGNETFRKSVEAILLRPKEGKVSLLARRFYNVLLQHAQANPVPEGAYHRITLSQLGKGAGYSSRDVQYLVQVVNSMLATVVNWGDVKQQKLASRYELNAAALLSFVRITKEGNGPAVLEYDFHKEVRAMLVNPSVYAVISLEMNAKMRTYPSLALYEILERYKTSKTGLSYKEHWTHWARMLTGNPHLSPTLQYKYFSRDVLKPALKEVNRSQSAYVLEVIEWKVARKVEALQFRVTAAVSSTDSMGQSEADADDAPLNVAELTLLGRLTDRKVPSKKAEQLVRAFGVAKAQWALAEVERRGSSVSNPAGYLIKLMEEGVYDPQSAGNEVVDVDVRDVPTVHSEGILASCAREFQKAQMAQRFEEFQRLDDLAQFALIEKFEAEVLEHLNVPLKRAWSKFRADWPIKPMNSFVAPAFKEWLIKDEPAPSPDAVMSWAYKTGYVQLGSAVN